jgi:hypothetical protein
MQKTAFLAFAAAALEQRQKRGRQQPLLRTRALTQHRGGRPLSRSEDKKPKVEKPKKIWFTNQLFLEG